MERKIEAESEREIAFVYFDLGNILYSFDPLVACQNVAERFGIDSDTVMSAVYGTGLQVDYESGHIRQEAFVERVCADLGITERTVSGEELLDCLSDMFTPIESMLDAVQGIRLRGIPTGVLSNTCRSHWDWINRIDIKKVMRDFSVYVLSFEVGAMKPDRAIFEAAEQASEDSPSKILFLDDRPENVDAAKARGWQAHQCLGGRDAEIILESYGLGTSR